VLELPPDDAFLGADAPVEGAGRHAGVLGDLLDGDVVVAAGVEQLERCLAQHLHGVVAPFAAT
jgi:hypothetical protein